jgi:hypothetical protein
MGFFKFFSKEKFQEKLNNGSLTLEKTNIWLTNILNAKVTANLDKIYD